MSFAAFDGVRRVPPAVNEPIRSYAPDSADRKNLKARIAAMEGEHVEIPVVIGGKRIHTGEYSFEWIYTRGDPHFLDAATYAVFAAERLGKRMAFVLA